MNYTPQPPRESAPVPPAPTDSHPPQAAPLPEYPAYYGRALGWDGTPLLGIFKILQLVSKRWLTLVLTTLFALMSAGFYLQRTPAVYEARALIELSVRRPRILNKQDALIDESLSSRQGDETLNTQIEKFKSPASLPVFAACYRAQVPDDPIAEEHLLARLQAGADFKLLRRTRLVEVTFRDPDQDFAIHACQALVAGTESSARAENREASNAAVSWLEAQAQNQKKELEEADRLLFEARQEHQLDVLNAQRKTVESALLGFNEALIQSESKAALEQQLLDALEAGHFPAEVPRAPELAHATEQVRLTTAELTQMLTRYTTNHPAVQAQQKAREQTIQQLAQTHQEINQAARANLQLYHTQAESLRQKKEEQILLASELDQKILAGQMKIMALDRTRNAADSSYLGILSRIQEARMSADENTTTVKPIQEAQPIGRIYPMPTPILLMALVAGLAVGLALAWIAEILADRIVSSADLETSSGLPVLGVIPHVHSRNRQAIATATLTHHFPELAEAFSGLRSMLESAAFRGKNKVILVSSTLPAEGKTTTSCNLAGAFSATGLKTLLIDFDLRRPRLNQIFAISRKQPGASEYLTDSAGSFADYVHSSEYPNLWLMTANNGASRPADLIGQAKTAEILKWARTEFDRILIDVPPLGVVSDALSLASHVDAVLLMARPTTSRKRALLHTIRQFKGMGVTTLALVMNDVHFSRFESYGLHYPAPNDRADLRAQTYIQ